MGPNHRPGNTHQSCEYRGSPPRTLRNQTRGSTTSFLVTRRTTLDGPLVARGVARTSPSRAGSCLVRAPVPTSSGTLALREMSKKAARRRR
jgi:hypothetical protein